MESSTGHTDATYTAINILLDELRLLLPDIHCGHTHSCVINIHVWIDTSKPNYANWSVYCTWLNVLIPLIPHKLPNYICAVGFVNDIGRWNVCGEYDNNQLGQNEWTIASHPNIKASDAARLCIADKFIENLIPNVYLEASHVYIFECRQKSCPNWWRCSKQLLCSFIAPRMRWPRRGKRININIEWCSWFRNRKQTHSQNNSIYSILCIVYSDELDVYSADNKHQWRSVCAMFEYDIKFMARMALLYVPIRR